MNFLLGFPREGPWYILKREKHNIKKVGHKSYIKLNIIVTKRNLEKDTCSGCIVPGPKEGQGDYLATGRHVLKLDRAAAQKADAHGLGGEGAGVGGRGGGEREKSV